MATEQRRTAKGEKNSGLKRLAYYALRGLAAVVSRIPLTLAFAICEGCADVVYLFDRRHREIGLFNLRIAFPDCNEEWHRGILRKSYRRVADHFVEVTRLSRTSAEEIRRRVTYEPGRGLENYETAKQLGRGVMYLTGHVGTWELLPLAQAVLRNPLNVVVRPLDNPLFDRWLSSVRQRFGNRVIPKESSLRRILKLFSQDEDVGILIDQNVQEKDGIFVPFFGHQSCTVASPAALALRTKTPVVFAFLIHSSPKGHYQIRFYPPIELISSEDREADVKKYTELFNQYLEEVIRENPDCWLWGHRRFRTQPDGRNPYEGI
jgi:KDO2-lipid IV(A) lauroyltransferase